ncbi:NAD(P)H dehydrogenase [Pectobacterium actinidiae]|uniref:FMN dependent NADH:quinone oxidoreductase n=1 Tax=Pectobacterium actinidiae TaxID=1507808 RepID=A0A1V2R7Z1_9GAMM|nr:NAD(P)H-dependent oxidoreductase [Pectobacterium actinidiae]KHN91236.1 NAD(P)H dehydrogenase (quinone) [Pectobacterium actinidiae]ONK02302.1 NAD(P)H dehydrogenase [Pectobacterium actinidiae]ONK08567.1 NAD(P)H dehydrogenase [Pectobacterium actinidiae]
MTKILHIDASARPGLGGIDLHGSYSRRLTHDFVKYWLSRQPDAAVRYRDVGLQPPDHINHSWIEAGFGSGLEPVEVDRVLEKSNEFVDELLWADLLVLGVPMYNFGMPSSLKAWIDKIVRLGRTLFYTPDVPGHPFTGAFSERPLPVVLLSSRGDHGMDPGGEYAHMNHLDPAIKTALGFIGINEIHCIAVEHQSEGGDALSHSLKSALSRTTDLADTLLATRGV